MNKNIIKKFMSLFIITFVVIVSTQVVFSQQNQLPHHSTNLNKEPKAWTALYYIDADTSNPWWNIFVNIDILENKFIHELASDDNLNVLVLQDRRRDPACIYYIDEHHNKIPLQELGEVNLGDPQTLSDFINYGKQQYPSERYQLCLWGHANAWYGVCPDDSSKGDALTIDEFQQALSYNNAVDLICFLGCCQMASLESVYELRDVCDVYVASEATGNGNDWYGIIDNMCRLLNNEGNLSTIEIGNRIVNLIGKNPNEFYDSLTISAIRTDKIQNLTRSIDALSIKLLGEYNESVTLCKSSINQSKKFYFIQNSYLLDIYDFVDQYLQIENDQAIRLVLTDIAMNLSEAIIAERHGSKQNGSHGLSIFYSSKGFISTYKNYGLDFTDDTHWDEFLDEYKQKQSSLASFLLNKSLIESFLPVFNV